MLLQAQNDPGPGPADPSVAVEKLKFASDELNKVHKYLMLSLEERCTSSLVVHRAQVRLQFFLS